MNNNSPPTEQTTITKNSVEDTMRVMRKSLNILGEVQTTTVNYELSAELKNSQVELDSNIKEFFGGFFEKKANQSKMPDFSIIITEFLIQKFQFKYEVQTITQLPYNKYILDCQLSKGNSSIFNTFQKIHLCVRNKNEAKKAASFQILSDFFPKIIQCIAYYFTMYNPAVIESLKNNSTEENADFIVAQDVPASPSTFDIQVKDYFKSKGGDMIDFKKLADLNFRTPSLVQMIDRLSLELIETPLNSKKELNFATISCQFHQKLKKTSLTFEYEIKPSFYIVKCYSDDLQK